MRRGRVCSIVVPMMQVHPRVRTADRPCADGLGQAAHTLSRRGAPREIVVWLAAYVFAAVILGTAVPSPLYAIYQRQWHFSAGILTLIFAVYAVAVLATLLLAGRASDQAGRKPVMAAAIAFSAASAVLFILAASPGWLYPARILSGVSAGLMTGTATATLTEMSRESAARRASLVAAAATPAPQRWARSWPACSPSTFRSRPWKSSRLTSASSPPRCWPWLPYLRRCPGGSGRACGSPAS